jgi:hypothetical protein
MKKHSGVFTTDEDIEDNDYDSANHKEFYPEGFVVRYYPPSTMCLLTKDNKL